MNQSSVGPLIDYTQFVSSRTHDFTGRGWVFEKLEDWLTQPGPRFFLLTGEPGSGKTAMSSRLYEFSQGTATPPPQFSRLQPGFLDAVHFCSARDRRWINPHTFAESIALQIAARHPAFAKALVERAGDRHIQIEVDQDIVEMQGGQVVGVAIKHLDVGGASPEDSFIRIVREPLEVLFRSEPNTRLVILVDALDEALVYTGDAGIVPLLAQADDLPPGVRFLVTSRPDERIENEFATMAAGVGHLSLSDNVWSAASRTDISEYIELRFRRDEPLAAQTGPLGPAATTQAVDLIAERAAGNFQYVHFLLDAVAEGRRSLRDLDELPTAATGLDALFALYFDSLRRVVRVGQRDWTQEYVPLMSVLSVAQEPLTRDQLHALSGQRETVFQRHLGDLLHFIERVPTGRGADGHRLYHQSFSDFLQTRSLSLEGRARSNTFYLPAADAHSQIGDHYLQRYAAGWDRCDDRYALRYIATHVGAAADESAQPERHRRAGQLVGLVTDERFQESYQEQLNDPVALRRDLERALATAATDDHADAGPLVFRAALALEALRREQVRPGLIFELARQGDVEAAERRLVLFRGEPGWRQAVMLTIAWIVAGNDPSAARGIRDRIVGEGMGTPLDLLVARLGADLDGTPLPSRSVLPSPPEEYLVMQILERLGGGNVSVTGLEPLSVNAEGLSEPMTTAQPISVRPDAVPGYLAEIDGPPLVAFATLDPVATRTQYLQQYISAHAANPYEFYRSRSLWALLEPILGHPDSVWVRDRLVELGMAALTGSSIEFRHALPLTLLALRARGDRRSAAELDAQRKQAQVNASELPGRGDPWAYHVRRLAALAEVHDRGLGRASVASDLLDQAANLPFGFAGFRAPALLLVAETARIVRPRGRQEVTRALDEARIAAHNVQDYTFCARMTSRVNAMTRRWWSTKFAFDPAEAVQAFARDPNTPRFAALHCVGEMYSGRDQGPAKLPIPAWVREASTLAQLARVYARSELELAHLNREQGWTLTQQLAPGTEVNIPDPDFAPLLAARLSAEALAPAALPAKRRAKLIQLLVPAAARDATSLDTVLSRLLLAAPSVDASALEHLATSFQRYAPQGQSATSSPTALVGGAAG